MNRFCGAEHIQNMRVGSDYQSRSFGQNWGMLIEELKLLARGVYVLDQAAFDRLSHDHIYASLGSFPARGLVWRWLKAGVVDRGRFGATMEGTRRAR
jgi:hypothetical protein